MVCGGDVAALARTGRLAHGPQRAFGLSQRQPPAGLGFHGSRAGPRPWAVVSHQLTVPQRGSAGSDPSRRLRSHGVPRGYCGLCNGAPGWKRSFRPLWRMPRDDAARVETSSHSACHPLPQTRSVPTCKQDLFHSRAGVLMTQRGTHLFEGREKLGAHGHLKQMAPGLGRRRRQRVGRWAHFPGGSGIRRSCE